MSERFVDFEFTKVFDKTLAAYNTDTRLIISYGGSSSSKTISILQLLTIIAINKPNKTITIIGETMPFLRRATISDWKKHVMKDLFDEECWNKTNSYYLFPNKSIIQFVSADKPDKFRGMRTDIAYFEEITNIKKEAYTQISIRTKDKVLCSFNPSHKFYIEEEMKRDDAAVIHSTYKDNQFCPASIVTELNQRGLNDINFKRVYLDGEWGSYEGLIFTEGYKWKIMNYQGRRMNPITHTLYGLDFGYTNDPTTLIKVTIAMDIKEIYIEELLYKTEQLNSDIAKVIKENEITHTIIADSANPKDIDELRLKYKIKIKGAKKGKGSILSGINKLKEFHININENSLNTIKEFRNYKWMTDKNGEGMNKPIDDFNHSIDAIRYAIEDLRDKQASTISSYF